MSVHFQVNSNQGHSRPIQDSTGLSETQESGGAYRNNLRKLKTDSSVYFDIQGPSGIQTEIGKNEAEIDQTISYAKHTLIKVDQKAKDCLINLQLEYGSNLLPQWLGKVLPEIISGDRDYISVQNARFVNSRAKTEVFEIQKKNVIVFVVDRVIRNRLCLLQTGFQFSSICRQLEISEDELSHLKRGVKVTIEKQNADKFNAYFQEWILKKSELSAEVFDLERIFRLALNEPALEEIPIKLSETTFIKMNGAHQNKMKCLPRRVQNKLSELIGHNFCNIRRQNKSITVRNAVLINKISEKKIFNFSVDSMIVFAIPFEQLKVLQVLIGENKMPKDIITTIYRLNSGQKSMSIQTANEINACFGRQVFDVESILSRAVQEAEERVSLQLPPSTSPTSKKRSFIDISSPEDHSYTNNLQDGEFENGGTLNLRQALPAANQPNLKLGDGGGLKADGFPTSSKTDSSDYSRVELNTKKPRMAAFSEHFVEKAHSPLNMDQQISFSRDLNSQIEIESHGSPPVIELFVPPCEFPPNDITVQFEFDPLHLWDDRALSISSEAHSSDVVNPSQDLSGLVEYGAKEEWKPGSNFNRLNQLSNRALDEEKYVFARNELKAV